MLLIKGILIPKIIYGIEIFRHRYSYLNGIKEVINRAIGKALRWPNFSRQAIYEELDIQPIEELGRYRQQKSLIEWQNSRGPIKELLNSNKYIKQNNGKSIKRTCINEANEWTKKNKIEITSKKELKAQLKEVYKIKKRLNPECKIQEFRDKYKLLSGIKNLKRELIPKSTNAMKLITGTKLNRLQLLGRGEISGLLHGKCLICEEFAPDTYEHWTLTCKNLENLRNIHLDNIIRILKATEGDA